MGSIRNGVTTTNHDDFMRYLRWSKPGDVVRTILFPQQTFQLRQEALHPGQLFLLECIMNKGDVARIHGLNRKLILLDERTFCDAIG